MSSDLPEDSRCLRLNDGRRLGYLDYGDPCGRPVFLFHGLPGSRLQGHPDRSIPASMGVRLISIDRPGFGLSDFQPDRTLQDWPNDVEALANSLGLDRFAVLGISGGGPYAASCARAIPDRLTAVAVISGMGPVHDLRMLNGMPWLNRLMLNLARQGEWPVRLPAALLLTIARELPDWYLSLMNAHLPAVDQAVYARPDIQISIREDMHEAFRRGSQGPVRDIIVLTRPWGFRLQDIQIPVQLWHGEQDKTVPVEIGRAVADAIPRCQARFVPQAGHLLVIEHWCEILGGLLLNMD